MKSKIYTNSNSAFPSQVVSEAEKSTLEYGTQVAQAIETEWFNQGRTNGNRFVTSWNNYHNLRLYARGEQSVQKYKDELSINGDLSYLNLDWKPVAVISKFVDIVVNGISNKNFEIKAFSQDPFSVKKRTDYATGLAKDMYAKEMLSNAMDQLGMNFQESSVPLNKLPESEEELEIHMQLSYKQAIEIAEEEAITATLAKNKWDLTKRRINYDLVTCGIAATKTSFNRANGIVIDYVDPAHMI